MLVIPKEAQRGTVPSLIDKEKNALSQEKELFRWEHAITKDNVAY
jgi:hypothetical protein